MVNVTLTRFVMARYLDYLLLRGQGQTKSISETLTFSYKVQKSPFCCPYSEEPKYNQILSQSQTYWFALQGLYRQSFISVRITKFQHG